MTTARELVTKSLRRSGAISAGETPDATEINDGLYALNDMIESWANDGLLVFARTEETFPLSGAQEYTVGAGQDFNTVPFNQVVSAFVRQGIDYYLTGITDTDYAQISVKYTTGTPEYFNYNNGYPVAKLKFYPVPVYGTLHILSEKPLTEFNLNTNVQLPPGWKKALIDNLAVDQAPEYGLEVSPRLEKSASDALASIKRQVAKSRTMDWDKTQSGYRDIYTGWV